MSSTEVDIIYTLTCVYDVCVFVIYVLNNMSLRVKRSNLVKINAFFSKGLPRPSGPQ